MDLKQLLEPMEYKMRAGPGGNQLAYIDARQAQDRLDEVCGPDNWKVEYKEIHGGLFAGVSIKVSSGTAPSYNNPSLPEQITGTQPKYEWVTKWDGGTESNIEKEKGLISDSFKRACVCWGIGRFLYGLGAKKGTGDKKPDYKKEPKKWYNDTKKHIDVWTDAVADGKTTGQAILDKITKTDGFSINGADKELILALDK